MSLRPGVTVGLLLVGGALVAVVATLLLSRLSNDERGSEESIVLPSLPEQGLPEPSLLIPNENERLLSHRFRPLREPRGVWTPEDIDRFWQDPKAITEEYLREEGRRGVETMLEKVP